MNSTGGILEKISVESNIPLDLVKTVFLLVLSVPLALGFRASKSPTFRQAYSLIIGLAYLTYLLQYWTVYVIAVALVPFILIKIFPHNSFLISLVTSSTFLLSIHTYRYLYDYMGWKIDCSVSVMYLVTKVVYFGHYSSDHKGKTSLFSYLSYCFFFPSVLIGPTFSFQTYKAFINQNQGYENPKIKFDLLGIELTKMLLFSIATAILMPIFTPYWVIENQTFLGLPAIIQFLSLNIIGVFYRIKFYSAWGLAQLSVDLSGLSWDDKNQNYQAVCTGSPRFQTQINPRNKTAFWNTSVQIWLKDMVFEKSIQWTKSSGIATLITFLVSALWHGVHLTYYVGFIQWAIITFISKWGYKMSLVLTSLSKNPIAKALTFLVSSSLLNYTGMFIVILSWKQAWQFYTNMKFIGNILLGLLLLTTLFIKAPKVKEAKSKST